MLLPCRDESDFTNNVEAFNINSFSNILILIKDMNSRFNNLRDIYLAKKINECQESHFLPHDNHDNVLSV